jgi:gliding motility-associated-like protein
MKLIITILIIVTSIISYSQNILMSNGSSTQCDGIFFDSGGQGSTGTSRYNNNENFIYTICPEPGKLTQVNFVYFDVESNDGLTIYDGDNTSAPVIGTYNNTSLLSGIIRASSSNTTGCLTFEFLSDDVTRTGGWEAQISCYLPCQTVLANANYSQPLISDNIQVCQNTAITFNGTGTYPENNTNYNQSDATSTFNWTIKQPSGTNITLVGPSQNLNFFNEGVYVVELRITDENGCRNSDLEDQIILVSTTPDFSSTIPTKDTICLGEINTITGIAVGVTANQNCSPGIGQDVFLPDGDGQSYETFSEVGCYNDGQTLTNINDIASICIDMEHSYLGDLTIEITCPTGQSIKIHDYDNNPNSGGEYLGEPIDTDANVAPGVGYIYCFSMAGTQTLDGAAASVASGNSIPAGNYLPIENFSGLIGCELNGAWKLTITDNLPSDNGYIFGWDIDFSNFIPTDGVSFTPSIASQSWTPNPTIQSISGNQITVLPTTTGNHCYTYNVSDNFGCNYDTTVCFYVNDVPTVNPITSQIVCDGEDFTDIIFVGTENTSFIWTNTNTDIGIPASGEGDLVGIYGTGTTPLGPNLVSTFTVTPIIEGACTGTPIQFTLTVKSTEKSSFELSSNFYCTSEGIQSPFNLDVTPGGTFGSESGLNVNPLTGSFDLTNLADGEYDLTYYTPGISGFCPTTNSVYFTVANASILTVLLPASQSKCDNTLFDATIFSGSTPGANYSWTNSNTAIGLAANGTGDIPAFMAQGTIDGTTGSISATITVTPIAEACATVGNSQSFIFTVNPKPILEINDDYTICAGDPAILTVINTSVSTSNCNWDNGFVGYTQTVFPILDTKYVVVADDQNGCSNKDSINIFVNSLPIVDAGTYPILCSNSSPITLVGSPNGGIFTGFGVTNGVFDPAFDDQTLTYTYTDPSTNCVASDQVTIVVSPLPTISINPIAPICNGANATLTASGATSYVWDNGLGSGASFTVSPTQNTLYTVIGTDANGCQNNTSIQIIVNPLPSIFAGNDISICLGNSTTITATGGTTYFWDNGLNLGATHEVSPTINTTYLVVGTDLNGCVNTDQINVTIIGPPVVSAGNDTTICAGNPITLTGSGTTNYSWNNGILDNISFIPPTGTTTYGLTGTSADGCTAYDEVVVTVLDQPIPIIGASVTEGTPTLSVVFENLSLNATSFIWDLGNGNPLINVSNFSSQTQSYSNINIYTVTLTASNGLCSNDTSILINVFNFSPAEIIVPNIFTPDGDNKNDFYYIDVKNGQSLSAQIFNRWGNLMYEMEGFFDANNPKTYWDGKVKDNEAKDGVYFIKYTITGIDGGVVNGHENLQLIRK